MLTAQDSLEPELHLGICPGSEGAKYSHFHPRGHSGTRSAPTAQSAVGAQEKLSGNIPGMSPGSHAQGQRRGTELVGGAEGIGGQHSARWALCSVVSPGTDPWHLVKEVPGAGQSCRPHPHTYLVTLRSYLL